MRWREKVAVTVAALAGVAVAGCDVAAVRSVQWPEACDLSLKPSETARLQHSDDIAPDAVRLSNYEAARCVRIASVWFAQREGTPEQIAPLAIGACRDPILTEIKAQATWEATSALSIGDSALAAELSSLRQELDASARAKGLDDLGLHRSAAMRTIAAAREAQCWLYLNEGELFALLPTP